MNLEGKDLCFFDVETTGLDTRNDRIVKISIVKIKADGTREERNKLFNPLIEISEQAISIHKITNDDVKDELPFSKFAKGILSFIQDCVLISFKGIKFDIQILYYEFLRANINWDYTTVITVDCAELWNFKETRKLKDAYKHFTGKDVEEDKLHDSMYDT